MTIQESAMAEVAPQADAGGQRALSARELEVLRLLVEGQTNKKVGTTLKISVKTVEKHRHRLMQKLDIHHITGLTRYAIATGLTATPRPIAFA